MKIFVSSTYTDLVDYRKAAERAINLLDQQFKGMEYFGARPEEPKAACLKEIEQADVFVGIYAHRYGFVPDGDAKSITEQEFDHAQKLGKPIFCYRVNADFPWSPKFIERGDAEKKLAAFIAHIEKDFVRGEFTTPDDLLAKISADLSRYLATHGAVALITHPLPPVPYYVHTYPLQANFTGRKSEREELNDWIGRDARSVFVLEAIGGMGKSALAWVWTQEIFSLGIPVAGVFWWSFYEERDLGRFLEKAIEYASGGKIDPKQIPSDRDRVDTLVNLLRQSRFLFVLDGFERVLRAYARMDAAYRGDEVDEDAQSNYRACTDPNLGILLRCLASGGMLTKTLITSRLFPRELDELESVRYLPLAGIDADDAVEFFHKQGIKGTPTEIKGACAAYGFHPLTLRLLAGALKQDPRYHADINNAPNVEMRDADKEKRMQRMLEFAYNSLPLQEQKLLSQLSAFRSPMKYETIQEIFATERTGNTEKEQKEKISVSPVANKRELARAISNLSERGLYMRDASTDTFDLHPVIRRYCYDRLADKPQTHAIFIVYFAKIETPKKIQSLSDLQATIELYHHTVRAGRYDEAWTLFRDRIWRSLYYQLGAYQTQIELLQALFPDDEDTLPLMKEDSLQAHALNELANAYSLAGHPRRAADVWKIALSFVEKLGEKKNFGTGLGNVASMAQVQLGELAAAERNLQRSIEICREIKDEFREAVGHQEFGNVQVYCGQFSEAERESVTAFEMFGKLKDVQSQSVVSAYRALLALFKGDASASLGAARKAREFAEKCAKNVPVERDFIRAEWLIGAALVASGNLVEAEKHLQEALSRDRKIGLVEVEAAILLQFAKLRFAQAGVSSQNSESRRNALMHESFNFANEALEIAERCEYRLQEAEIQNFLAEYWVAMADEGRMTKDERSSSVVRHSSREALAEARKHAERAEERAWCDGPPYHYKVAYEQAERMIAKLDKETR